MLREEYPGKVLYQDFEAALLQFIRKEKIFSESLVQGIRYDLVTKKELLLFL